MPVGSKSRPDQAISIEVMKLLMENMEAEVKGGGGQCWKGRT